MWQYRSGLNAGAVDLAMDIADAFRRQGRMLADDWPVQMRELTIR